MRAISIILKLAAIVFGALLLVRALYATEAGHRILRLVPHRTWGSPEKCSVQTSAMLNLAGCSVEDHYQMQDYPNVYSPD